MTRSNGRSNGKEDVTQIKAPVCNASTVTNENECIDLLLIKDKHGYKIRDEQHQKVLTILIPKTVPKLNSFALYFD